MPVSCPDPIGEFALSKVPTDSGRIDGGIHQHPDPVDLIVAENAELHYRDQRPQPQARQHQDLAAGDSGAKQHHDRDEGEHEHGPEVGLEEDQNARQSHDGQSLADPTPPQLHLGPAEHRRQGEDTGGLGELGWLQLKVSEIEPPLGALHRRKEEDQARAARSSPR